MTDKARFVVLGPLHFAVVAAGLLLIILVLVSLAWPGLAEEYVLVVEAPTLEAAFGFHADYVAVGEAECRCRVYAITALDLQGRLAQAGFREGDWLSSGICTFYGDYVAAQAFLADLRRVESGETVEFFVTIHESGGYDIRRVTLPPRPSKAEGSGRCRRTRACSGRSGPALSSVVGPTRR